MISEQLRAEVRQRLAAAVRELREAVAIELEEGVRESGVSPATLERLGRSVAAGCMTVPRPVEAVMPPPAATVTGGDPESRLEEIARRIAVCTRCPLHRTRNRTVPGQGCARPELVFVGEGPGAEEDRQGLAFVGPAGQLLTRLITRMGFTREQVFIANIVKCRPTEGGAGVRDRPPSEEEMAACLPYLQEQLEVLRPKVIVCLGGTATLGLLGLKGITKLRGRWHEYRGIPVMPTYHPSYLLRAGGDQTTRFWEVWDDMCQVLERLGRPIPPTPRRPR
ncbi:MAG: uracil-DNA glycosylase [Kiritimatiellae bacterium]|nr:uracil-DNA glycosylase [Kiritimatiellia bacterium]